MAHQVNPLRTLVTDEFKEINTENYEDYFDKAQEEVTRLKVENTELLASNEKLTKKLVKKKNELEIENKNLITCRQLVQELNTKFQQLEKCHPSQPEVATGMLGSEQKREVEELNLTIEYYKHKLSQATETPDSKEITEIQPKLSLGEELLEESKNTFANSENEKELLRQQLDQEKRSTMKLKFEIEQFSNLKAEVSKLENINKHLNQNRERREIDLRVKNEELERIKANYKRKEDSNNETLQRFREKDEIIKKLTNELETLKVDFGNEKAIFLQEKDNEIALLEQNFQETEIELRNQIKDAKKDLEYYSEVDNEQTVESVLSEKSKLKEPIEILPQKCKKQIHDSVNNPESLEDFEFNLTEPLELSQIEESISTDVNSINSQDLGVSAKTDKEAIHLKAQGRSYQDIDSIRYLLKAKNTQISDLELQILSFQETQDEMVEEITQLRSDNEDLENVRSLLDSLLIAETNRSSTLDCLGKNPRNSPRFVSSHFSKPMKVPQTPDLTPPIVRVVNSTGKSTTRIPLRSGLTVNTVKLSSLPSPVDNQGNQVISKVNKLYEVGILMVLFEIQTKVNFRTLTVKYAGIRLFNPVGNCNGEFRTNRYFECEQNYGICVPYEDVLVPVV